MSGQDEAVSLSRPYVKTPEHCAHLSEALTGRVFSEEHKAKLSAAWTPERRARLSDSSKGKSLSQETKDKIRASHVGSHHTEETKRLIGQASAKRQHVVSAETRAKISATLKGNVPSEYCRQRLREVHTGNKWAVGNPGRSSQSPETRQKIAAIKRAWVADLKAQGKPFPTAEPMKKRWQDPEYATEQRRKIMAALASKPNKAERALAVILEPFGFRFVGDGQHIIAGKCPDFWNDKDSLVELFGDYWHAGEDPATRIRFFESYGYRTLVIWEHELKDAGCLLERVREFCD